MKNKSINPACQYKYAISFAGKYRDYARAISEKFPSTLFFYDDNDDIKRLFPGQDITEILHAIYSQSEKVIILNSVEYQNGQWTETESAAIKERLLRNRWNCDFIIPVYMDDTILKYLPNYVGYICAGNCSRTTLEKTSPQKLADIISDIFESPSRIEEFLCYHKTTDFFKELINEADKAFSDLNITHTLIRQEKYALLTLQKEHCHLEIQFDNDYLGANGCSIFIKYFPLRNSLCATKITDSTLPNFQVQNTECGYLISILDNNNPFIIEKKDARSSLQLIVEKLIDECWGECKCLILN